MGKLTRVPQWSCVPFDNVHAEALRRPVRWNIKFIERFMLVLGPISSLSDFLTFFALLWLFGAGEPMFQTGGRSPPSPSLFSSSERGDHPGGACRTPC